MKKWVLILFCYLFVVSTICNARVYQLYFGWTPNVEEDLAGYRLYQTITPTQYVYGLEHAVAWVSGLPGQTRNIVLDVDHVPGTEETYYWVLTAYDTSGNESGPSNEVSYYIDEVRPETIKDLAKWMLRKFREGVVWITKV